MGIIEALATSGCEKVSDRRGVFDSCSSSALVLASTMVQPFDNPVLRWRSALHEAAACTSYVHPRHVDIRDRKAQFTVMPNSYMKAAP